MRPVLGKVLVWDELVVFAVTGAGIGGHVADRTFDVIDIVQQLPVAAVDF